jgi:hypothetical protein
MDKLGPRSEQADDRTLRATITVMTDGRPKILNNKGTHRNDWLKLGQSESDAAYDGRQFGAIRSSRASDAYLEISLGT